MAGVDAFRGGGNASWWGLSERAAMGGVGRIAGREKKIIKKSPGGGWGGGFYCGAWSDGPAI